MKTVKLQQQKLSLFLPHGWVSEVAKVLGVCRATISRNVQRGNKYGLLLVFLYLCGVVSRFLTI